MKFILGAIAIILVLAFVGFLLPAIIGVIIGILMIKDGSVIGGLIAIVIGIIINVAMVVGGALESGSGADGGASHIYENECPNFGSSDTDGNHCFECGKDF